MKFTHRFTSCFAVLISPLLLAGCGASDVVTPGKPTVEQPEASPASDESAPSEPAETTTAMKPEDVKLTEADWETVQKKIAEHSGKIVVLDLWSTSCQPCIREFHNLVELSEKQPEQVVCLSFSLDYAGIKSKPPAYYEERVRKFLSEQGATFDNYLCSQDPEEVYAALDLASIPAVMVFGRDGKLVEQFDNDEQKYGEEFTYHDHVLPLVERLVTDSAPPAAD